MRITILTTGGTIDKTYNELDGSLKNTRSVLDVLLGTLRLPDLFVRHQAVMNMDSLDMTESDRLQIVRAVRDAMPTSDAIIILHGTDTLANTGDLLFDRFDQLTVPIILTGAMRPYEFRDSDALQNVTESLLAARLLDPGVYVVMHNRVLPLPGVFKDRQSLTFRAKAIER